MEIDEFEFLDNTTYVDLLPRFFAFLIDFFFPFFVINYFFYGQYLFLFLLLQVDEAPAVNLMVILVNLVVFWIYYAGMHSSDRMATVGKIAFGLKVTNDQGRRLSFSAATIRYFTKVCTGLLLGIGFIMAIFNPKRKAMHDVLAGSLVLKLR